jgi:exo-poly-alpha-galacturonosidase
MIRGKFLLALFASLFLLPLVAWSADDAASTTPKRYVIAEHGAVGDGQTLNTKAIQDLIDRAAAEGGGVIVVPEGTFLTGSIFLKQGVSLLVEKEGVLKGSTNPEDYPTVKTRWEGIERDFTAALVNAVDMTGVEVNGDGTIDGSGDQWVDKSRKQQSQSAQRTGGNTPALQHRPRLICFQNCRKVRIADLSLKNQALWCLHILYCEDVVAENLTIRASRPKAGPNDTSGDPTLRYKPAIISDTIFIPSSDGIDPDSSRNVRISKCDIDVNDDCISIKAGKDADGARVNKPCENVIIENCRFGYGHGGVAMGSEVTGGIRNVEVRDCLAEDDNWEPIRFKSQPSRGGVVENIIYRNFELKNTRNALTFNMEWRMVGQQPPPAKVPTVVRNVRIINVTGTVKTVGNMHGMKQSPIENVTFENCKITAQKGLTLENVKNIDLSGLELTVKQGEPIIWKGGKPETEKQQ